MQVEFRCQKCGTIIHYDSKSINPEEIAKSHQCWSIPLHPGHDSKLYKYGKELHMRVCDSCLYTFIDSFVVPIAD